jgi:hypothetical protein
MKIAILNPLEKFDYLAHTIIDGLSQTKNVEFKALHLSNGITPENHLPTCKDFLHYAKEADYVFVLWGKLPIDAPQKYGIHNGELLDELNQWHKVVYFDGSEWTSTGHRTPNQIELSKSNPKHRRGEPWVNEEMLAKCLAYFKRECYPEDQKRGIIPISFGITKDMPPKEIIPLHKRPIDIFVCFGHTLTGLRQEVEQFCIALQGTNPHLNICVEKNLDKKTYQYYLQNSKICIDAWGAGDINARFYEIVAAGAICFYQKPNVIFHPKQDTDYCYFYNSIAELKRKLQELTPKEYDNQRIKYRFSSKFLVQFDVLWWIFLKRTIPLKK